MAIGEVSTPAQCDGANTTTPAEETELVTVTTTTRCRLTSSQIRKGQTSESWERLHVSLTHKLIERDQDWLPSVSRFELNIYGTGTAEEVLRALINAQNEVLALMDRFKKNNKKSDA